MGKGRDGMEVKNIVCLMLVNIAMFKYVYDVKSTWTRHFSSFCSICVKLSWCGHG